MTSALVASAVAGTSRSSKRKLMPGARIGQPAGKSTRRAQSAPTIVRADQRQRVAEDRCERVTVRVVSRPRDAQVVERSGRRVAELHHEDQQAPRPRVQPRDVCLDGLAGDWCGCRRTGRGGTGQCAAARNRCQEHNHNAEMAGARRCTERSASVSLRGVAVDAPEQCCWRFELGATSDELLSDGSGSRPKSRPLYLVG
jgi:hypothetical protein